VIQGAALGCESLDFLPWLVGREALWKARPWTGSAGVGVRQMLRPMEDALGVEGRMGMVLQGTEPVYSIRLSREN
jgi:hypothetical protein